MVLATFRDTDVTTCWMCSIIPVVWIISLY